MSGVAIYQKTINNVLNDVSINSEKTSDTIFCPQFNQCTAYLKYTYDAGTAVLMYADASLDGVTWFQIPENDNSLPPTVEGDARKWSWTHGGASENWVWSFPLNYPYVRLRVSATGSPTASDKVTVDVRLARL